MVSTILPERETPLPQMIIEQLTHATFMETGNESYRFKHRKKRVQKNRKSGNFWALTDGKFWALIDMKHAQNMYC
jgi:hypothetical protein